MSRDHFQKCSQDLNEAVETLLSISRSSNNEDSVCVSTHLVTDNLGTPPQSEDEFDSNFHDDNSLSFDANENNIKNNNSELARVCILRNYLFQSSRNQFLNHLILAQLKNIYFKCTYSQNWL